MVAVLFDLGDDPASRRSAAEMDERNRDPNPSGRDPYSLESDAQPALSRLEPPSGRGSGHWRLAAAGLSLVLLTVIAVGRFGMQERQSAELPPPLTPLRTPAEAALASPSPGTSGTPTQPSRRLPLGQTPMDGPRYLDGIPTSIRGTTVYRLAEALDRGDSEHAVLVGGWYVGPDCSRLALCPYGLLADSPAAIDRAGTAQVEGRLEFGAGPRVMRAKVHECADGTDCRPRLEVLRMVWAGDFFTQTGPIEAQALLAALAYAYPEMRAVPFRDLARCPVFWPPQTYRSTSGGPRMTLVFPSVEDRVAAEAEIVASWPWPPEGAAGQCTDHLMAVAEPAGWIARDNVMLWIDEREAVRALAEAALKDATAESWRNDAAAVELPSPLTTWQALRALRGWEPSLDILPVHDLWVEIWSPVPEGGSYEAYAFSDPFVQVLLVFPTRAERRAFQAVVNAEDVAAIGCCNLRPTLAARLREATLGDVRWLAFRNVLLQVSGPREFDDRLREALADSLR